MLLRKRPDEIDIKILRILQRGGRIYLQILQKRCKVSTDAIIRCLNKMKKRGVYLWNYNPTKP
ncbi:MAG: hypothetical protein DRN96_08760 [Thermoproteota archaeon]|nr:MAG: hypothetical protein DRN96_08760 [Candidatus Korarchaeota archaeon]